ncbi:MAG: DSD1 family PLP-dependent enzyme [Bacillota bacterium]
MGHEYEIGLSKWDLETPALLVDLDAVERNIQTMADFCRSRDIALRPHAKIYKATPAFAWMQLRAGVIGLTVAKLSEAETLASAGIRDILIANQVVGERKIRRLVNLAAYTDVIVGADCLDNALAISQMASARGVEVGILVEVNIGNNRCGTEPFEPTERLAREILKLPGLRLRGIMGYDGHLAFVADKTEQRERSLQSYRLLVEVRDYLKNSGIPVEIVSGGGTATYTYAAEVEGITELQAGTYIFNDTTYYDNGRTDFECVLTVLGTVISMTEQPDGGRIAILDVGRKSFSLSYGFPRMKQPEGELFSMPQEHSRLRLKDDPCLSVGDKVEIWVKDANETVNLYNHIYAMRGDIVEAVWDIPARGRSV